MTKSDLHTAAIDLRSDLGETKNLIAQHPREAERLKACLKAIVEAGRSRP